MAGARGRLRKTVDSAAPRRSTRRTRSSQQDEGVPAVFQEMLREEQAEQAARTTSTDEDERPVKKRKTAPSQRTSSPIPQPPTKTSSERVREVASPVPSRVKASPQPRQGPSHSQVQLLDATRPRSRDVTPANGRQRQTIVDSDESDGSDEEWEDALADGSDTDEQDEVAQVTPQVADISITIGGNKSEEMSVKRKLRRRAITSVDKKKRLDIHKMHVLCLLYHVHRRNAWCNDLRVQTTLRKLVPPKTLLNLVPNPDLTQYSASKRFVDGMNELKTLWSKRFKLTAQGMYKPKWAEADADIRPFSDFDDLDDPMDKDDFRNTAHILQGSQDVGTQLFCALLRGIGVEARLVCSLQPLPFASSAQPSTPQKTGTQKNMIVVDPYNRHDDASPSSPHPSAAARPKKLSRLERVMGERHAVLNKTGVAPQKQKAYHTPYPVYWVEAFNAAHQKWVAIDTHSTFTVNSPEKLEPPLSFAQNSLTYAIAFEEDYTSKDVTRRYAKAYSAKTRKLRVECTPHGADWWRRTTRFFERRRPLDRDQVEDAALARKEASEGVPKNVQDFKDHPVYVLERHLKHNEVIHPLEPVGKVNVGSGMNPKMESIYRRKNVHVVRSADKWYRMGQDVKDGEQPLKHAKPKKVRQMSIGPDMDVDEQQDEVGAGLYAEFQTQLYIPPPVVRGRVPRNAYGNLDLYVPSMCPPGGTHMRHKLASKAARIVGVDYADAVTGFSFKGRHGTAIVQGVVVASEYAEAVQEVIDGMIYAQEEAANAARTRESLRLWRRFFLGLRIAQRVNAIEIDGEKGPVLDVQDEIDKQDKQMVEKEMAGGFFPDEADFAQPTRTSRNYEPPEQDYGGGFMAEEEDDAGGGFIPEPAETNAAQSRGPMLIREHSFESSILESQTLRPRRRSSFAEDYILEEEDSENDGGGFIRDDEAEAGPSNSKAHRGQQDGAADQAGGFIAENEDEDKDVETTQAIQASLHPPPNSPPHNIDTAMSSPSSSPPSSTTSLPLEDPEDEDADPDWLVDAT
ncbi:Rad4-domain-containing protein [Ophiobolus disseminans]|uniref:Rad4-domain-containing protein n=1 Tax=Ophiobolus disseminans TaxID=1469910 RepID=A0A6A7ADX5_9PLEO|nr:Rad4-domain-containing protein [Ophiobolus disseminans]